MNSEPTPCAIRNLKFAYATETDNNCASRELKCRNLSVGARKEARHLRGQHEGSLLILCDGDAVQK